MPLIRVLLQIRGSFSFRRLKLGVDLCVAGSITFAELDASVQGWINPAACRCRLPRTVGLTPHHPHVPVQQCLWRVRRLQVYSCSPSTTVARPAQRLWQPTPARFQERHSSGKRG